MRTDRLDKHAVFMVQAMAAAERGTCARRAVGCVLVSHRGHILSTGYNGGSTGLHHCIDTQCPGVSRKSGEGLDECIAIHAEQNALLQCPDVQQIHSAYCTTSPCRHCLKLLMNTSCRNIYFHEPYVDSDYAIELWSASRENRRMECIVSATIIEALDRLETTAHRVFTGSETDRRFHRI